MGIGTFASISNYLTSELTAAVCVILTTFFTGLMALGIWYMKRSLAEAEKTRKVAAWQTLLQTWGDESSRKARKYIFNELDYSSLEELTEDEQTIIETTLASCNRISYMVLYGLINDKDVLYFIGPSMLKIYDKLYPFIKDRRLKVGEAQDGSSPYTYMSFFQEFITKYRAELEKGK